MDDGIVHDVLAAMSGQWPPCIRDFFRAGGSMRPVIKSTVEAAWREDPLFGGDPSMNDFYRQQLKDLPECRNDSEYAMVLRNLLINRLDDGTVSPQETRMDLGLKTHEDIFGTSAEMIIANQPGAVISWTALKRQASPSEDLPVGGASRSQPESRKRRKFD